MAALPNGVGPTGQRNFGVHALIVELKATNAVQVWPGVGIIRVVMPGRAGL